MNQKIIAVLAGLLCGVALVFAASDPVRQDAESNLLIRTDETIAISVGSEGDYKTLEEALDWSSGRVFINGGSLTITLAEGEHILDCYVFRNMNARSVFITGPTMVGEMPLAAEMSGDREADLDLIKSRFGAWIVIRGEQKYGLALPYGIGSIDNLAIINPDTYGDGPTRYTISCGLQSSWETSETSSSIRLGNTAVIGGVWGINAVGCRVTNKNKLFFAYQFNGGPVHLSSNSQYRGFSVAHDFQAYAPKAQYGMICHDSSAWMDNACTIRGANIAFLANGGGARIDASAAKVIECQVVASAESGGVINIPFHEATNCDATPGEATVELWKGLAFGRRAVYFSGAGGLVNIYQAKITGVVGTYGFYAVAGGRIIGGSVVLNDYHFPTLPHGALAYADSGSEMIVGITALNPRQESGSQIVADNGGRIYAQGSQGVEYIPSESGKMDVEGSLVVH